MKQTDVTPEIDAAARYLRETKQASQRLLVPWDRVPWAQRKKWTTLAAGALAAAAAARTRNPNVDRVLGIAALDSDVIRQSDGLLVGDLRQVAEFPVATREA